MNTPLIDALRGMDDDEKEVQIGETDGTPVKLNVGPLDKAAGNLLHNIKAIYGEAANDPDWVTALLNSAQFWLTLGCSMSGEDSNVRVEKDPDEFIIEKIPQHIPKRSWNG